MVFPFKKGKPTAAEAGRRLVFAVAAAGVRARAPNPAHAAVATGRHPVLFTETTLGTSQLPTKVVKREKKQLRHAALEEDQDVIQGLGLSVF